MPGFPLEMHPRDLTFVTFLDHFRQPCAQVHYPTKVVISAFCQLLLCVSTYLGHVSMAQLETVIQRVLLRLADGKGITALDQQVSLEWGVDRITWLAVRQPTIRVSSDCSPGGGPRGPLGSCTATQFRS